MLILSPDRQCGQEYFYQEWHKQKCLCTSRAILRLRNPER